MMKKLDQILENIYKYSCNNTASLKSMQTTFDQAPLAIKQAKHHRWLSHDQAVSSIVRSYSAIIADLESFSISSDPVDNGILKNLKDHTVLRCLLLLADTLPHISSLSLLFQRRDVNLGMVKTNVDKTLRMFETRKTQDEPWQMKANQMATDLQITPSSSSDFDNQVETPFIDQLIANISDRFEDNDVIDQLSIVDLSGTEDELPSLYGFSEMFTLAAHFKMEPEDLQTKWQNFIQLLNSSPIQDRTLPQLTKLLHNSDSTRLKEMYLLVYRLLSIATTLPLSTAEVERVFSRVKLIKTSHRSRLTTTTLKRLLNIKLNCTQTMFEDLLDNTAADFFPQKKQTNNQTVLIDICDLILLLENCSLY